MKKLIVLTMVFTASFLLINCGFGNDPYNQATVNLNGTDFTIFYSVNDRTDITWEGLQYGEKRYRLWDDAAKYPGSLTRFFVFASVHNGEFNGAAPMNFHEINDQSFLQRIILENNWSMGQAIFEDIIYQIEKIRLEESPR